MPSPEDVQAHADATVQKAYEESSGGEIWCQTRLTEELTNPASTNPEDMAAIVAAWWHRATFIEREDFITELKNKHNIK